MKFRILALFAPLPPPRSRLYTTAAPETRRRRANLIQRKVHYGAAHGLRTPNEGINQLNLKCFGRMWQSKILRSQLKIWIWSVHNSPYHYSVLRGAAQTSFVKGEPQNYFRGRDVLIK